MADDPSKEDVDRALRWLDQYLQSKGHFAAAAKVQRRAGEYLGMATFMARYANARLAGD